ncbi:MAG: FHA domain-containing protein [Thermoanaerobaculia bacterium]|nr:MAG: FHA domain-containing protein [Thermoanaerobaculia bacterium]MBZ0103080.1 FHA domain-containing protein [Thermoanaerobaculia bacterium]
MLRVRWSHQGREEVRSLSRDEIRIGRGTENDIVLPDFSVSRRHAVLSREPEGWAVTDQGSTNGVLVNLVTVKRALVRAGDRIKIGNFELAVEEAPEERRSTAEAPTVHVAGIATAAAAPPPSIGTQTIVRSLAEFSEQYGLDPAGKASGAARLDKRKALEAAYSTKIFGFMTRLAQLLIRSESVDEVLARVFELAFEALPVDRGFILLRNERTGENVCEISRVKDRIEYRPQGDVPVSRTMVEQVIRDRVALLTYDAQSDQRLAGGESIRIHQIRAAMCAPLWSGEKIIGVLQLDTPFHAGTFTEQDLDLLAALANFAAVAVERLRNAEAAERERQVRARLERYHSPSVLESIVAADPEAAETVVGRVKLVDATVLFADLAGFTALSEKLEPAEVAEMLEGFFTPAVEAIFREGGTLDKFIGDCVMAFFGAPVAQADHAPRAVRAALAILDAQETWNAERAARGQPTLDVRIAINSGPVVVGDVGSRKRVDYTVLGNTVNVAARLEAYVGEAGQVTIGGETHRQLGGALPTEPLGEFQLKGLEQRVTAHRVLRR